MPAEAWIQAALQVPVLVLALVGVKLLSERFDRIESAQREHAARVIDILREALVVERSDPGRRHVTDEETHDGDTWPEGRSKPIVTRRK